MRYDAFLSYSHAADGKLAPALQSGLHRFAKRWYQIRALRVFRDQTNLSVNPALWSSIERALSDSEHFLVLASPEAARSKWVQREMEYWLAHRTPNNLLVILTDGEMLWSPTAGDFDWQRTTALPATMRGALRDEPLYLDLRWAKSIEHLSLSHPRFRDAIADLAAPLHGLDKDEVIGEDVRQHRRTVWITRLVILSLVILTSAVGAAGYLAFQQRNEATRQQRAAEDRLVRLHVASGSRLLDEGDLGGSLVWFAEAVRFGQGNSAQKEMLDMRLGSALRQHPALAQVWFPEKPISTTVGTDGTRVVALREDGTARVWDLRSGAAIGPPVRRPRAEVVDVTFARGGTWVLATTADDTAHLWDAATGRDIASLPHEGAVNCAAFNGDGTRVVTGSADGTARVWEAGTGRRNIVLPHGNAVLDARFSAKGDRVVTLAADQTVRVWDAETPRAVTLKLHGPLAQLEISPDGTLVLAITEDRSARLWSGVTGEVVSSLGDWAWVDHAAFSPDGRWVSMASRSGWIYLWDVKKDSEGKDIQLKAIPIHTVFSADSRRLVTSATDGTAQVWDVNTGRAVTPPLWHDDVVHEAAFAPDGRRLVTVTAGGVVRVWDLKPAELTLQHDEPVRYAAFSADGTRILTTTDWTAELWTATQSPGKSTTRMILKTGDQLYHAAFSPDGKRVITSTEDHSARVWDVATGRVTMSLAHDRRVKHAAFSRDGKLLATASGNRVTLWDTATGRKVASMHTDDEYPILSVDFDHDGERVLGVAFGDVVRVWDVASRAAIPTLQYRDVNRASFSPDGKMLATAGPARAVRFWDARTGAPAPGAPIEVTDRVTRLAFSPDGRRLVTATGQEARVWDVSSGRAIIRPLEHGKVMTATFSPDGTRVLTTSTDGTARVWDANTGESAGPPLHHRGAVLYADFSPDGRRVVTASDDGTARIWDVSPAGRPTSELVALAQSLAARRMDETGALVPLTTARFRDAWNILHPPVP